FVASNCIQGVLINPALPEMFDQTPNAERSREEKARWWDRPYIVSDKNERWPHGVRYTVRMLDGGAWDRSTNHGMYGSIEEAVARALELLP
ncbi:hypothetical protein G9Q13_28680, partial [Klebsiella pneumoniae]|nr:hypothetical protein [Klebsiella pneumoniae]